MATARTGAQISKETIHLLNKSYKGKHKISNVVVRIANAYIKKLGLTRHQATIRAWHIVQEQYAKLDKIYK